MKINNANTCGTNLVKLSCQQLWSTSPKNHHQREYAFPRTAHM